MTSIKTRVFLSALPTLFIWLSACHRPHTESACSCACADRESKAAAPVSVKPAPSKIAANPTAAYSKPRIPGARPPAKPPDIKALNALRIPSIYRRSPWRRHRAKRPVSDISRMKTGQKCGIDRCTGGARSLTEQSEPTGREVCCKRHLIHTTKTTGVETGPPRKTKIWGNCSALKDGRNGEKCRGNFACFQKTEDKQCIERVACKESAFGADKLLRYLVCDDIASSPSVVASEKIYTDCESAKDARPLDRCSREFLCEVENAMKEIPPCDHRKGFCPVKWGDNMWTPLLYCDGETLHLFTFNSRV